LIEILCVLLGDVDKELQSWTIILRYKKSLNINYISILEIVNSKNILNSFLEVLVKKNQASGLMAFLVLVEYSNTKCCFLDSHARIMLINKVSINFR